MSGPVTKAANRLVKVAEAFDAATTFEETAAQFRALMTAINGILRAIKPAVIEANA